MRASFPVRKPGKLAVSLPIEWRNSLEYGKGRSSRCTRDALGSGGARVVIVDDLLSPPAALRSRVRRARSEAGARNLVAYAFVDRARRARRPLAARPRFPVVSLIQYA